MGSSIANTRCASSADSSNTHLAVILVEQCVGTIEPKSSYNHLCCLSHCAAIPLVAIALALPVCCFNIRCFPKIRC